MFFMLTAIVSIDPCFQFVSTQQPVRFRDGPLAMESYAQKLWMKAKAAYPG
jgi:hypothetical protein